MNCSRDFPGSSVVRTLHFYCRGYGFNLWLRNGNSTSCKVWKKTKQNRIVTKSNNLFEMIYHIGRLKLTCLFWPIFWVISPPFFLEMKSSEWKPCISLVWGKACVPLVMTDSHCGNDRFISTLAAVLTYHLSKLSYRWYFQGSSKLPWVIKNFLI